MHHRSDETGGYRWLVLQLDAFTREAVFNPSPAKFDGRCKPAITWLSCRNVRGVAEG